MKEIDQYHKWVEWDDADKVYIGKCPDLITGIHGDDPVKLYGELCETVGDVILQASAAPNSAYARSWLIEAIGYFVPVYNN